MEQDERPEDEERLMTFTSDTLLALQRAARSLEAALRESSRLSRRGGPPDGVSA
jgi:hypothetical protein